MIIRPFDAGNWFAINNAVFDHIMPKLSSSAWKILCVTIRATWGWATNEGRKTEDIISYSQFLERSGIGSDHTITAAINECIEAGYIVRREVSRSRGTNRPIYAYALNIDFELDIAATAKTAPAATAKTAPAATAKTALTKENKQTKGGGGDVFKLLVQSGISTSIAENLAPTTSREIAEAWLNYIREKPDIKSPAGFLVSKLRLGELPPIAQAPNEDTEKRHRYIEGKYADLIKH